MDLLLPAGVYNFLQTNLPNKRYDIVCELEKKQAFNEEGNSNTEKMISLRVQIQLTKLTAEEFKDKVDKLKILYESDMITEQEFRERKEELLRSI